MEDRFSIMRYMPYLQPGGTTLQGIEALNRRTNNVVPAFTPYSMAPAPRTSYMDLQSMNPEPIDPFLDYQSPGLLSNLSTGLQVAQTAPQLLNVKLGKQTFGERLGLNFGGPGTKIANPFTQTVSTAPNIIPTASTISGAGAPALTQSVFNPATGAQMSLAPGAPIPPGFELAPAQLTGSQMASNYFNNLSSGSISAGVPTYIAGRVIRSAFDDDDPTTFKAGEMAGAAISGAGAASAIMALSPKLAALGPAGIALGIAISLFGGKKKRDKARKLQRAYENALKEREAEIREMYQESVTESRKDREGEARAANYMRTASKFNNPYGTGNYDKGGLTPKEKAKIAKMGRNGDTELAHITKTEEYLLKMLGGAGTINPETGLKEFHLRNPFSRKGRRHNRRHLNNAVKAVKENVLDPVMGGVQSGFDAAADVTEATIDTVSDVGQTALEATTDVAQTTARPIFDTMEVVGENVIEPVAENVLQPGLNTGFKFVEAGGEVLQKGIETGIDLAMEGIEFAGGMAQAGMEAVGKVAVPIIETIAEPIAKGVQAGGSALFDFIQGDDDIPDFNLPPMPNIETAETVQDPNIVTIDPYTGRPTKKAFDLSLASGSAGFVRPDDVEKENIYSETQESV